MESTNPKDLREQGEKPLDEQLSPITSGGTTQNEPVQSLDAAAAILGKDLTAPREVSPEENDRVLRKIDLWLLPIMCMVYFIQQLDKSALSYASVFGIQKAADLHGQQYSWLGEQAIDNFPGAR